MGRKEGGRTFCKLFVNSVFHRVFHRFSTPIFGEIGIGFRDLE